VHESGNFTPSGINTTKTCFHNETKYIHAYRHDMSPETHIKLV
jgi:hypothetical protein